MARKTSKTPAGDSSRVDHPAGTLSTDKPESEAQSGAGNPVGPAGGAGVDASIQQALAKGDLVKADELISKVETDFRAVCPNLSAALDVWQAAGNENPPTAVRIAAKVEGFRRADIAHSKEPREYPIESFKLPWTPEQLEKLLGEPNLVVELI